VSALRLGGADTPAAPGVHQASVCFTGRREGDLAVPTGLDPAVDPAVLARRRAVVDRPWTWLRQVHGAAVIRVDRPGDGAGQEADAAVTADPGAALAVFTADCAPIALASPEGVIGVAHAGWRGLVAGVIEATVVAMRELGAGTVWALLGPCIHVECYQFGDAELALASDRLGPSVIGVDRHGRPALDVPAGVRVAVERAGATLVGDLDICTACSPDHWSWRARADRSRQAAVVWLDRGALAGPALTGPALTGPALTGPALTGD
jgi:YfiH family protein